MWINEELADHRIIVKDIEEDMYDGQVLQKLVGMPCGICVIVIYMWVAAATDRERG